MIQNPEHVSLDPQHAAVLANVAQQTGKSFQQLVADAIDLAFVEQQEVSAQQQRQNLSELLERTSQLPIRHPQDGLSGRDHDRVLYGPNES
jgi:hypothetical protein